MAQEAESMDTKTKLLLNIKHAAHDLDSNGNLAYYFGCSRSASDNEKNFHVEEFEQSMIEVMQLIKRYNDEVKELVKWAFGF